MKEMHHTIGNGKEFLAPGAVATLKSISAYERGPGLSDKYELFSTLNVVSSLAQANWLPVMAQEQSIRSLDRDGFQKHMVRFRQPTDTPVTLNGILPELILTNAHDGRSRYCLMAGFFRLACLNGLIVSQAEFASIFFRHIGFDEKDVIEASYKVIEDVPKIAEKIEDYRKIELDPREQRALAESALILRFSKPESTISTPFEEINQDSGELTIDQRTFSVNSLLRPLRKLDEKPTLWNIFNVVQEKISKGNGFENTIHKNETLVTKINKKVRGINGINQNIEFNRGLWHLMEEMRKIKMGPQASVI